MKMALKSEAKLDRERLRPCICVVDDDDAVRDSLDLFLSLKGMNVVAFGSARPLLDCDTALAAHLLILDVHMPGMDGFTLLEALRLRGVAAPVILMSGLGDRHIAARAEVSGAAAFFEKPIDPQALLATVRQLLGGSTA